MMVWSHSMCLHGQCGSKPCGCVISETMRETAFQNYRRDIFIAVLISLAYLLSSNIVCFYHVFSSV